MTDDELTHITERDIGALHCVLYRDQTGAHLVSLFARGPGSWSSRWRGMLRVDGAASVGDLAKVIAWAREVRS